MSKADPKEDTYSEAETVARMEAALKRAFATPHKPHQATKATPKRASDQAKR
jgi:hypothetical protein